MNRLWVRLLMAFTLVTVIGVLVVALLAKTQINRQFRHFMGMDQLQSSVLPEQLGAYYGERGNWQGVEALLRSAHLPGGMGHGMGRDAPTTILANVDGQVIYVNGAAQTGAVLTSQQRAEALPLRWRQEIVGYLLVDAPGQGELPPAAQQYLGQLNSTLLQAGLLAGGVGIILGLVIARGLAAPLRRLVAATQRISHGQLDQRVPVGGPDEVASLAIAFNDMAASLAQGEQLRRSMVADIAHELRTPLSVLRGNLQAILDDVYPLAKEEIAQLHDETLVLTRLVQDLYELAQAEARQLPLEPQQLALEPLLTRMGALFGEFADNQQIAVLVEVPKDLPAVYADAERVQQVVHNLLANALRYTPSGGSIRILAGALPEIQAVRVSIEDTGPGIAVADLPHVFERFWRAEGSRSREHGGSGLGLAIAKQLVEAQGGQIGVENRREQGSRFWFTLPTRPPLPGAPLAH